MIEINMKGVPVLLDDADADLCVHRWFITPNKYVMAVIDQHMTYMHRVILSRKLGRALLPKEDTDHVNRKRSDNRRENLRSATRSQNLANKEPHKRASSGCIGVYKDMSYKKKPWKVQVRKKTIGRFLTIEQAVTERDNYIMKNNIQFVRLSND